MTDVAIPMGEGGFGGMGAGLGGLIGGLVLGSIWSGNGWGGWGGNRGVPAGQIGADVILQNGIQNLQNAVNQAAVDQAQGVGNLGLAIANTGAGVTAGITQNTITGLQGQNALQQQMCCCCKELGRDIDAAGDQTTAAINQAAIQGMQNTQLMADRLCATNQNITNQGYESRLQAQALASQLQAQHADLKATIQQENCADRELMRQIADQQTRDKLFESQNENAALKAQLNLTAQLQQQTLYLINQLKPAETTPAAAGA